MPPYADDIVQLDQTLANNQFSSVRSLFSPTFLLRAGKKSEDWGCLMPPWYAYYADHFKGEQFNLQRLRALELVLSNLRDVPGKSNSRKALEKRILDPSFAGSEAFFEVMMLAAGLSLQRDFVVELYPELPRGRPEFSVGSGERRIFFEATCFKLKGRAYLPRSGEALTRVALSESRLKTKLEDKRGQLPRNSPSVLLFGNMGIDPAENQDQLATRIIEAARQHFFTAVLVFWFNPLSDPFLIQSEYLDSGTSETTNDRDVIEKLQRCFRTSAIVG